MGTGKSDTRVFSEITSLDRFILGCEFETLSYSEYPLSSLYVDRKNLLKLKTLILLLFCY